MSARDEQLEEAWAQHAEQDEVAPGAYDPRKFDDEGHRIAPLDWTDDPQ